MARTWRAVEGGDGSYCSGNIGAAAAVAAFDLDDTLCQYKTTNMALFPVMLAHVLEKLQMGFHVVIFSNRKQIDASTHAFFAELDAKCGGPVVYAYVLAGAWRKPHTAAWRDFCRLAGIPAEAADKSSFCGDAAGRHGDFGSNDVNFAHNCGMQFYTPEDVLRRDGHGVPRIGMPRVGVPRVGAAYPPLATLVLRCDPEAVRLHREAVMKIHADFKDKRVCLIMFGVQGCGKTTLARELADMQPRTTVLSRDATKAQWKRQLVRALAGDAQWVILDATAHTRAARADIYNEAGCYGRLAAVVVPTLGRERAVADCWLWAHLRAARVEMGGAVVPTVAVRTLVKHIEPPAKNETTYEVPFALHGDVPAIQRFRYTINGDD